MAVKKKKLSQQRAAPSTSLLDERLAAIELGLALVTEWILAQGVEKKKEIEIKIMKEKADG